VQESWQKWKIHCLTVADPGEGCRGCMPPPEGRFLFCIFFISLNIWCLYSSAPPPENGAPPVNNPGSALVWDKKAYHYDVRFSFKEQGVFAQFTQTRGFSLHFSTMHTLRPSLCQCYGYKKFKATKSYTEQKKTLEIKLGDIWNPICRFWRYLLSTVLTHIQIFISSLMCN